MLKIIAAAGIALAATFHLAIGAFAQAPQFVPRDENPEDSAPAKYHTDNDALDTAPANKARRGARNWRASMYVAPANASSTMKNEPRSQRPTTTKSLVPSAR